MQIVAATWSYPPARFIGSELMTHRLLVALAAEGHDITVLVKEGDVDAAWEVDGIHVQHRNAARRPRADLVICHADLAMKAWLMARRDRARILAICHNTGPGVRMNLERIPFDLVVVNSESMKAELNAEGAIVVNPPLRDHRQSDVEQGWPLLAHRAPAA